MKAAFRTLILLCCPALLASAASLPQSDSQRTPAQIPPAEIKKLIEDLGNRSFKMRQNANKCLRDIGLPALPQLTQAENSTDLETQQRAKLLAKSIRLDHRVTTHVNAMEFEAVVEVDPAGRTNPAMVGFATYKVGLRITNKSNTVYRLNLGDLVQPHLSNSKGDYLPPVHGHYGATLLTPRPITLVTDESHTIWCNGTLKTANGKSSFACSRGNLHWAFLELSKGTYGISLTYENQSESANVVPYWIGSAKTQPTSFVID